MVCCQSQDFGKMLDRAFCPNSRISVDIARKLGPLFKLDKRNTRTLKKFDDDIISDNYDNIIIFPIKDRFAEIHMLDTGCMGPNS